MKPYSLRRRLIATVLLLECALVLGFSVALHLYLWRAHMHGFDATLRGRADSLLGQVHDAEDANDDVTIDAKALDLKGQDLWMARDGGGRVLTHSATWNSEVANAMGSSAEPHSFRVNRETYRGLALHGVRQIDADDSSPGIARPVTIFYAASLEPVYEAIHRDERFLLLASSLLLLITGAALAFVLRRGLAPLEELSLAAAAITPREPRFRAPESARATTELALLAGALDSATQRLEQAFRQQQVFVHDAAHELKTAVTIVKSSLQLLASRPRSAREYSSGLETCLGDCARMEELVQRMLQLARFEGAPANRNVRCNLAEVARDVVTQMETLAEIRQVRMAVEAPDSAQVLLTDEACGSLMANLLLNAVQHTPVGGTVTATIAAGHEISLDVRDTGSGIPAEDIPHLFERFWRGDSSRSRSTGGTGLGLSICQAIVDSCGGRIEIASRVGEGTCVTVVFPAATEPRRGETLQLKEPAIH